MNEQKTRIKIKLMFAMENVSGLDLRKYIKKNCACL